ncbi:MAG: hypothetical protein JWO31_2001 [Phycisphaerales bacterium]|nr:hypothetical protein [Phycisphaerales bacterium]
MPGVRGGAENKSDSKLTHYLRTPATDGGTGGAMAMPRKLTAVLLAAGGVLVVSVGLCAVLEDPLNFGDHKAPHTVPTP